MIRPFGQHYYNVSKTQTPEAIQTPVAANEIAVEKNNANAVADKSNLTSTKISHTNKIADFSKVAATKNAGENLNSQTTNSNASQTEEKISITENSSSTTNPVVQGNNTQPATQITAPQQEVKHQEETPVENPADASTVSDKTSEPANSTAGCQIKLTNTFTPSGDDINDNYFVSDKNLKEMHVKILDLRGKILKQWDRADGYWDGKLPNGSEAPTGKYVLIINGVCIDGLPYTSKTIIKLIRQ